MCYCVEQLSVCICMFVFVCAKEISEVVCVCGIDRE